MKPSLYLVAGIGKTGRSIAAYLQRRNRPFVAFDTRPNPDCLVEFKQQFPGIDVFLGDLPEELFPQLVEIIASPGVSLDEPFIRAAYAQQIPVIGDIECLAREIEVPVLAITGTNGKSTVTALVGEMVQQAGYRVAIAGNIGTPVLELLDDENDYEVWVLELSSFQLDLVQSLRPKAATILNLSPDHLDRHHNIENYKAAKQRIYRHSQFCIYNKDDGHTYPQNIDFSEVNLHNFSLNTPTAGEWGIIRRNERPFLAQGEEPLLAVEELKIKGKHNWQNALAACALAASLHIDKTIMVSVLKSFAGLPHRCQWVRTMAGVDWINDSKGTNVGATISAVAGIAGAIAGKIVLIAGGLGKGADFSELCPVVTQFVRSVVLIGRDAPLIAAALEGYVPIIHAQDLNNAVNIAQGQAQSGDVVLLSPACASFDMFRDFNHRGELFTEAVGRL